MKVKLGSGMNNNNCEISLSLMWYCRIWLNLVFWVRALIQHPVLHRFCCQTLYKQQFYTLVMQALQNNKNFTPYSSTQCRKWKHVTKKACWNIWLKTKHMKKHGFQPLLEPLKDTPSYLSFWEGARDIQAPAAEQSRAERCCTQNL